MPVAFIKKNVLVNGTYQSKWVQIKKIYLKKNGVWTSLATAYVKKVVSGVSKWVKVFEGTGPTLNSAPVLSSSKGGKLYDTFTTTNGSWDNAISFTRIWIRSDTENGIYSAISGATSTTYTTTNADDGKWIRSEVTASDGSRQNQAASAAVNITKYKPVNISTPTLSGSTRVDSSLFVTGTGTSYWRNTTDYSSDTYPNTFSYYWQKSNGTVAANNSDSDTYTPKAGDVGHQIRCKITATNSGGSTEAYSGFSAAIEAKLKPGKMATPTASDITTTSIKWNFVKPTITATNDEAITFHYYTNTTGVAPADSDAGELGGGFITGSSQSLTLSYTSSTSPTKQYLWVRAQNNYGDAGEWSDRAEATPTAEVTRIAAPTGATVTGGTAVNVASTQLVRIDNNTKDQYWSIVRRRPMSLSWDAVTGATSYEYHYNGDGTTPAETIDLAFTTSVTTTSKSESFDASPFGNQTWYFWVRSKATASNYSTWVYMGNVTVAQISVTSFVLRIYRGNGTSFTTATKAYAWDDFNYAWNNLISRGNPSSGGEGHFARMIFTVNGTSLTRDTNTV